MEQYTEQYKSVLTALIKKQMVILGPSVAFGTAKKVTTLTITPDGTVTDIAGDPVASMKLLAQSYMNLSGQIAQNTLDSILQQHPDLVKQSLEG